MLPRSLEAATIQMMRQGSVAREVFGDDFVEHFGGTREHEVGLWNAAVTNWEGPSQIFCYLLTLSLTKSGNQWNVTLNSHNTPRVPICTNVMLVPGNRYEGCLDPP
jgi:hypothetical protein